MTTKKFNFFLVLLLMAFAANTSAWASNNKGGKTGSKTSYTIKPNAARPAGQKHVLGLVTPKLETVRVGFIGLGMRGPGAVERFAHIPGVEIKALCDLHPERVNKCQEILKKTIFLKLLPTAEIMMRGKNYATATISTSFTSLPIGKRMQT